MQQTQQQQQTAALVRQLQQQLSSKSLTSLLEHLSVSAFVTELGIHKKNYFPVLCRFTARTGHQFIFLITLAVLCGDGAMGWVKRVESHQQGKYQCV